MLCKARINGTTTNITLLSPKIDVVLALCRHHPSVLQCAVTKRGTTALMGAALRGYATVCQALLEEGADIDAVNDQNQTALSFAASQGHRDAVFVLLDHGGSKVINMQDTGGRTPLLHAITGAHVGCVQRLLEARCSTDVVDAHCRTPLLIAASNGSVEICRMLVKNGANINVSSPGGGITPLMASIDNEHVECSYILMDELRADVYQRNTQGACALTYACKRGLSSIAVALVQIGVPVDSSNNRGTTPLMVAANNGHSNICRFLLDNGANLDAVNADHATPIDCASTPEVNTMFVEYLRKQEDTGTAGSSKTEEGSNRRIRNRNVRISDNNSNSRGSSSSGSKANEEFRNDRIERLGSSLTLQEAVNAIDASIAATSRSVTATPTNQNTSRHREETLRALQEQHESITSSFLGQNDIDPEEIHRINAILAERMANFYDMCERDNENILSGHALQNVNVRTNSWQSEVTALRRMEESNSKVDEEEDFTYRPQSLEEPTTIPPPPPQKSEMSEEKTDVNGSDSDEDDDSMISFQCPITQVRMTDPVTCMDGHTYERTGIERWLKDHDTSPLTGVKLPSKLLLPNHSLRNAIEEYRSNRRKK